MIGNPLLRANLRANAVRPYMRYHMIKLLKRHSIPLLFVITGVFTLAMIVAFIINVTKPDSIDYSASGYSELEANEGNLSVEEKLDYIFGK